MKFKLLRPTLDTPFHIDWNWFERNHIDAQSVIRNQLCAACEAEFSDQQEVEEVDYIDPESGEVFRMDGMREAILAHCRSEPDYINSDSPLTQAIMRLFLANNNRAMTPNEIADALNRHDADTILRLLTASGVKNGIVPVKY